MELHLVCPRLSAESFKGTCSCAFFFFASASDFASAIDWPWRLIRELVMRNHGHGKNAVSRSLLVAFQDKLWGRNASLPLFSRLPEGSYREELLILRQRLPVLINPSPHALLVHLWTDHILVLVSRGEAWVAIVLHFHQLVWIVGAVGKQY